MRLAMRCRRVQERTELGHQPDVNFPMNLDFLASTTYFTAGVWENFTPRSVEWDPGNSDASTGYAVLEALQNATNEASLRNDRRAGLQRKADYVEAGVDVKMRSSASLF